MPIETPLHSNHRLTFDRVIVGDMKRHQQTLNCIRQGLSEQDARLLPQAQVQSKWNEFDFKQLVQAFIQQFPAQQVHDPVKPMDYFRLLKLALESWAAGELSENVPEQWFEFEQRITAMLDGIKNIKAKE